MYNYNSIFKKFILVFVSVFYMHFGYTQNLISIKGEITDSSERKHLYNASINLIRSKDSILLSTTRANNNGQFILNTLYEGKYILMITYPQYADFIDKIELANGQELNLGKVYLNTKVNLLKDVIIKNTLSAIRVKGDTTEYKADSFRVTPNADVQELIKKMPGFQVNSKGEITTQGEKVNKVLVDGEEFFSDDPAVVTKNLRADAVDKVQVFDKKSDQAAFTGIDDGQTSKTINLQLKEDKKNGHYGKFELGSNLDKYSNGKALINAFKGKKKFAGYLTTDNTKFEGLSWDEQRNYADGGNTVTSLGDDGSMSIIFSSGDDYDEQIGLPNQQSGGLVLANKWGNTSTNNTGQYQRLQSDAKGTSYTKTILSNAILNNNTINDQLVDKRKYRFNTINEWGKDSTGLFKITLKAANTLKDASVSYFGLTTNEFGIKINQTERQTSLSEDDKLLISNLSYRKKYAKKGRTISVLSDLNFNDKAQDATLISENSFFNAANSPTFVEKVDQIKANQQTTSSIASNVVYTEPLSEKSFLILKYGLTIAKNDAERVTSNNNGAIVDSLSNHFVFNTVNNSGSLSYRYVAKKVNFIIGSGVGTANYQLNDLELGTNRGINFTNFIPSASLNFNPKQQRKIRFNYNGNTINPTLQQIQPIIDNSDPLNIAVGNADLQQGFSNKFSFNASDYKVLKSRSISLNANYTATNNAITNSSQVDANGRTIRKYINVDGSFNYNFNIGYGFDVFKGINLSVRMGKTFSRYINFVNDVKNTNNNNGINYNISLNYWNDTWFNFYWNLYAGNNQSTSTIRPNIITNYWSYVSYGNFNFNFKKAKTYVSIENEFNVYQKSAAFPDQRNIYLVSPSIRKVIGKKDQFELKLFAFDLFNQNANVSRNISSNFISETTNNGIRRYFLLGFVYNFSKNSKPPSFD
jgi:hypothetical protein